MIRRGFWLVLGAVLGVTGYRRVSALARSLTPRPRPAGRAPLAPPRSVSALRRARQAARFAADVRDGMAIYMERHPPRTPNTLERQQARTARPAAGAQRAGRPENAEDGR